MIENIIRLFCRLFTSTSVFIFVILSQLVDIYIEIISALVEVEISNTANIFAGQKEIKNQVAHYFSYLGTLNYASQHLKRSFELPLIINYILSIVMMITSSYYTVEFIHDRIAVVFLWEIIDVLQFFVRFCLICNTVDNLCKLVSIFYRKLTSYILNLHSKKKTLNAHRA
jgi:hypothetical protein